jgi:hypothetical protein
MSGLSGLSGLRFLHSFRPAEKEDHHHEPDRQTDNVAAGPAGVGSLKPSVGPLPALRGFALGEGRISEQEAHRLDTELRRRRARIVVPFVRLGALARF